MTLSINPADTWKQGNNIGFMIGTGSLKNSGNFTKSDTAITSRNRNYTAVAGDN